MFFVDIEWKKSGLSLKVSPRGRQNCLIRIPKNFWGKTFLSKTSAVLVTFGFCEKLSFFCCKFLGVVVKTGFSVAIGNFWRSKVYLRKLCYFQKFRTSIKKFGLLAKNFRQFCQNCSLSVHRNTVRKKFSTEFFLSFVDIEWKCSGFLLIISRQGRQNCLQRVPKVILREIIFDKSLFSVFLDIEQKNSRLLARFFELGSKNCCLSVHWKFLRNNIEKFYFFEFIFGPWTMNFRFFDKNICSRFVKTALYVVAGTAWGKKLTGKIFFILIFSRRWAKFLSFLQKKIWQCCQTCNLSIWEQFEEKHFLSKIHYFFSLFGHGVISFAFGPKSSSGVVKTAFYMSIGTFWWKNKFYEKG